MCTQHTRTHSLAVTEPWTRLRLPAPDARNTTAVLRKLRTKLRLGAHRAGGAGYIYVYCIQQEHEAVSDAYYWKVGMTERTVDARLAEWAAVHGAKHTVALVKSYQVASGCKWVERVIHLYLDYCRVYRYAKEDGTFLSLAPGVGQPKEKGRTRIPASRKFCEWFSCEFFMELDQVIESVVQLQRPLPLPRPKM